MEACDLALTELRKEKIEVNREKKRLCVLFIYTFDYCCYSCGIANIRFASHYRVEEIAVLDEKLEADSPKANGVTNGTNGAVGDISMETINSDLDSERPVDSDAASDTPGSNHTANGRITSNRQRALHLKSQSIATAKQRAIARTKAAEAKATLAERRKLDEELNKHEKRLEGIEREFRKLLGVSRARPLGKDRFHNRVWWFDGMGGGTLVAGGGQVAWGTGRIFFQGPSDVDLDLMRGKGDEVEVRRVEEEGEEGMLAPGEWAYFSKTEQVRPRIFVICCAYPTLLMSDYRLGRGISCLAQSKGQSRVGAQERASQVDGSYSPWDEEAIFRGFLFFPELNFGVLIHGFV